MDGNMLSNGYINCEFDSGNRLIFAGGHTYTYNAEDVRIRNVRDGYDTTYTYNTNARLSQLLVKTTNGITTKYVYGLGLIGEEKCDEFKTYHFDYRGSTIAITDSYGYVIDTFEYDLYGNVTNHNGCSFVIFGYNGRDGVVTDNNGLIYMRARYYSPELKRFINADIIPGEISDSTSLNRYSYVNGNPASLVDPFGLSADERYVTRYYSHSNVNGTGIDYIGKPWEVEIRKSFNSLYPCKLWESGKQGPLCPITDLDLAVLGYCTFCGVKGCCSDTSATNISLDGLEFIATYETFHAKPYDDGYGNMTIGYGHLIRRGEKFTEITENQALVLLYDEVAEWEQAVIEYSNKLGVEWSQNEFDALVSLAFNSGYNFKNVIDDIVKGGDPYDEFDDIIKSNGIKSLGLYRRRMDEADIFVHGEYDREDRKWP